MRKLLLAILVVATDSVLPATAQSKAEQALYKNLTAGGSPGASSAALDKVLTNSGAFSALILYSASGVAFRDKRLEDAGFLFYAAQLRAQLDKAQFPPTGTGGNNPMLALGALKQQLGQGINPALMRQPNTYATSIERLKSWTPKTPRDYEPGWEYSKRRTEKEVEQEVASKRQEYLSHMAGLSTLLLDTNYFKAFQTAQDYNLGSSRATNRPSKEAYDSAVLTLKRIEKEKGIEALGAVMK